MSAASGMLYAFVALASTRLGAGRGVWVDQRRNERNFASSTQGTIVVLRINRVRLLACVLLA